MERFHPALESVLRDEGWTGLTPAQEELWPHRTGNVLLVAPTGYGKTEAAVLPVLDRLLRERDVLTRRGRWPPGIKALMVTPLRALNRDLLLRLEAWGERLGLRVGVRHGDTSQAERARQSRNPPDFLITTPETVQLLLYGDRLRAHLRTVRFVIVDEIHDLAASERGAQLMVALERIEEVIAQNTDAKAADRPCPTQPTGGDGFVRMGLSATVADPAAVARFLGGRRPVEIVVVAGEKRRELTVVAPPMGDADHVDAGRLGMPPESVAELRAVQEIISSHARVLVFQNTRDGAELMVSRNHALGGPGMDLHHGSLSAEHRADVETRFKQGQVHALVATSSLELGIDVGAIDHVVQVHSPRSVARFLQRLGRAGHRVGAISSGTLVGAGAEDLMECAVIAERAAVGALEPLRIRDEPLVVLANQLVALTNEYAGLERNWVYALVTRAGPFLDLDEGMFGMVWDALVEVKTLFPDERGRMARGGRARKHFLEHVSLIPDEKKYRVFDEAAKRTIGTVDDAFVAAGLRPGNLFIMAGRNWTVLEVDAEAARVRVAEVRDIGAVPQWSGSQLPVSFEVAQDVAALRRRIVAGEMPFAALQAAAAPIRAQLESGLTVPTDQVVTLEGTRGHVVANVALGTRGNEALARLTQVLLQPRIGTLSVDSDAYRIHFHGPSLRAADIEEIWSDLDPDALEYLLGVAMRESPVVRHHLVLVAKQFGALPKALDPNRTTRARLDMLLDNMALQEETLARLIHERLDLDAVASFLRTMREGELEIVVQGIGPVSRLGDERNKRMVNAPRDDAALLDEVRRRIEKSDVLMACCNCAHTWNSTVGDLPPRIHCRRCQSIQVACLRPWHDEQTRWLRPNRTDLTTQQKKERARMIKNGALVSGFGRLACAALVGRGIGPDVAGRILEKAQDAADPRFWRAVLQAELDFARTSAFW